MDQDISFNLETNLQRMSTVEISAALWGSKTIQEKIKLYSYGEEDDTKCGNTTDDEWVTLERTSEQEGDEKWEDIIDNVLKHSGSLNLPPKLLFELQKTIFFMGERIHAWRLFVVMQKLYKFSKFSSNLYWTPSGLIDEMKIYESLKNDPGFPGFREPDLNKLKLYTMACMYGDMEYLQKKSCMYGDMEYLQKQSCMYGDLEYLLKQSLNEIKWMINKDFDKIMSAFISCHTFDSRDWVVEDQFSDDSLSETEYMDYDHFIDVHVEREGNGHTCSSKAEKLFLICVGHGFEKASDYFYDKIKDTSEITILEKAAMKCIKVSGVHRYNYTKPKERIPELLFILNKMSDTQKKEYLMKNIKNVYLFLFNIWPYQELCIPILDLVWKDLEDDSKLEILQATLDAIKLNAKNLNIYNSIHQPVLLFILKNLTEGLKLKFFSSNQNLFNLFKISNFTMIEVIINDPQLSKHREKLTDLSPYLADYLIKHGGKACYIIKEYITSLKLTNDEKINLIKFSDEFDLFETLIREDRLESADEILNLLCEIHQDEITHHKRIIRASLDVLNICYDLVSTFGFETMEKYLTWQYGEDANDLEDMKKKIFSPEFICEVFWDEWIYHCRDVKLAQEICSELLKKFVKNEEVKPFKEKLLQDENFVKILMDHTACSWDLYDRIVQHLDQACVIFSMSIMEITRVKRKIKENFGAWMDSFSEKGFKLKQFFAINSLINWVCDTEQEKKEIIEEHLNSSKIALFWVGLCKQGLDPFLEDRWFKVKKVLLKWVKKCDDFERIKDEMDKMEGRNGMTGDDICKFKDLLSEIQRWKILNNLCR